MALGFKTSADFSPVVGWELYQVTLDKYHVMFFFENGWQLLNVAHSFSHRSADDRVSYTFELYGDRKTVELDRLLRKKVTEVNVRGRDRLALMFEGGDELIVHDHPDSRSWWFMPINNPDDERSRASWAISDVEPFEVPPPARG